MSPERGENSLNRAKVVEQLQTPWGPLNKRVSQDVLAAIGRETGLFQVPQILSLDEALAKAELIDDVGARVQKRERIPGAYKLQYPLMRSYLHDPLADNLLCGYLPTLEPGSHKVSGAYDDMVCESVEQQAGARVYLEQMGFPAEGLERFGLFFQERIGGKDTEKVVVIDTADGAYVEVVPHRSWMKKGFLFADGELSYSLCPDWIGQHYAAAVARETYLRHLIIKDRFYRGKPFDGRFPLVGEWVHRDGSDEDEFYAVQLRASLVTRPYVFGVIKLADTVTYDYSQIIDIDFRHPAEEINRQLEGFDGYRLWVKGTGTFLSDNLSSSPLSIRYGQPAGILINHEKAADIMGHQLFSVIQAIHSLGGEIQIVDMEGRVTDKGGVKYYSNRA